MSLIDVEEMSVAFYYDKNQISKFNSTMSRVKFGNLEFKVKNIYRYDKFLHKLVNLHKEILRENLEKEKETNE